MTPAPGHLAGGVWGVVATPFCGPKAEVDEPSLARLVEHYGKLAVAGLTALGVFGEAARQSMAERRIVLGIIARTSDLPVVAGCTGLATQPVIEEAMAAHDALGGQLAAIMVQVNTPSADALAAHLRGVHEATGCRIVVQDYPAATGVRIEPGELAAAVAGTPTIAAIKAESPPTPTVIAALTAAVEVPVFGGFGGISLLDELACGAAGAMTGFSYPEALIACVDAFRDNGLAAARSVFAPWLPLVNFEQHAGPALTVRKQCLLRRGLIAESAVRPPAPRMPPGLDALLGQHLDAADALLDGAAQRAWLSWSRHVAMKVTAIAHDSPLCVDTLVQSSMFVPHANGMFCPLQKRMIAGPPIACPWQGRPRHPARHLPAETAP